MTTMLANGYVFESLLYSVPIVCSVLVVTGLVDLVRPGFLPKQLNNALSCLIAVSTHRRQAVQVLLTLVSRCILNTGFPSNIGMGYGTCQHVPTVGQMAREM